ncbi:hypothetical protein CDQ92_10630 [Sphingopyxis bauzanensis]|uniref:Uncharacterized protein n=1 Tax=Sphingopyxis bauzanensis TaxID=651663 RepID=A0A246JWM9_9SPHN|nr:hypothetical protein [Sphingopyxis bauzanensis]OWQ97465.1 hypothetical protein CDQ92_10630 [Sphingopyxis bauzanensis]GGJ36261.1 hypothetical protein GCM10011393_03350 [Sphingopyxis bauzanensis]
MTQQKADERDLEFNELQEIDENQLTMRSALNLRDLVSRKPFVWNAAGENGGLVIRFDPELFLSALECVRLPGLSTTAEGRNSKIEVAVFENEIRMRSQSPYITFEAGLPLKEPVSGLPKGGLAFLIKPSRFDPFFSQTSVIRHGEERRISKRRDTSRAFDMFEYLVDEGVLVLALKSMRLGLKVETATPSAALPKVDPETAVSLPSISALAQALRCAAYVKSGATSQKHTPIAVIKDGQCTALFRSRAAIFESVEIAGLELAMPLNTPLKLATMLGRLRDPARIAIIENQALIDDGHLRCAFPIAPPSPPAIDRDAQVQQCENSTWTTGLDDLQHIWGVFNVIAGDKSEIDLTVVEEDGDITLRPRMDESGSSGWHKIDLMAPRPPKVSDVVPYRAARVIFRDLSKAIEKITEHRPTISINSSAVIITEIAEKYRRVYFIGRSDITTP